MGDDTTCWECGKEMAKTKVGQAGKTLDIRLPKKIIEFMRLKKGVEVTLTPENKNKITITV